MIIWFFAEKNEEKDYLPVVIREKTDYGSLFRDIGRLAYTFKTTFH